MAEFTLLKVEFPDASFTANAPFGGSEGADVESDDGESEDEGLSLVPLFVGLVFLVALAVAVRKLRGGTGESQVEVADDDHVPVAE